MLRLIKKYKYLRRRLRVAILLALVCLGAGCTHHVGYLSLASQRYFTPANYDWSNAEKVFSTGESHQLVFYIWDIQPLATIQEAISDAIAKVDGDFMTNIKIQQREVGVILFGRKTIQVEGVVYKIPKAKT
jgi:hypothetical protein